MLSEEYFDLTTSSLEDIKISKNKSDTFDLIIHNANKQFSGFIISKTEKGMKTLCDVSFHKNGNSKSHKHVVRFKFRKTDKDFKTRNVNKGSEAVIISFYNEEHDRVNFWSMIGFFYKFQEILDLENFVNSFSVTDSNISNVFKSFDSKDKKDAILKVLSKLDLSNLENIDNLVNITRIKNFIKIWQDNKDKNQKEEFWQKIFEENSIIFSNLFNQLFIIIQNKAYCGGKMVDNTGGNLVDFIFQSPFSKNITFIEIKTPKTEIVSSKVYRDSVYSLSSDLTGGIAQVLNYRSTSVKDKNSIDEDNKTRVYNSKCILLIGEINSLEEVQKKSFELFRNSFHDVEIITFDELFAKVGNILKYVG